tara:strand:- start:1920 stop:2537 length:618 start_codon:yes stop_codon:yes gene_type:complete
MYQGEKSLNLFFTKNIFLGSFYEIDKIPNKNIPECCFLGRSNVGKSSIINSISQSKKLAKVSKTPGRTQSINVFELSKKLNIVDLPGYGYSNLSKNSQEYLSRLLLSYLNKRNNLKKIYILIDCKVGIKEIDINALDIIASLNTFFGIILTKIDKCSYAIMKKQKNSILSLLENYPKSSKNILTISNKNNEGISDIQKDIFTLTD